MELIPIWCPDFCDCYQGSPLLHLAFMVSGADICRYCNTVTNEDRVLNQLPPPRHSKRQQIQELSLSVKETY